MHFSFFIVFLLRIMLWDTYILRYELILYFCILLCFYCFILLYTFVFYCFYRNFCNCQQWRNKDIQSLFDSFLRARTPGKTYSQLGKSQQAYSAEMLWALWLVVLVVFGAVDKRLAACMSGPLSVSSIGWQILFFVMWICIDRNLLYIWFNYIFTFRIAFKFT